MLKIYCKAVSTTSSSSIFVSPVVNEILKFENRTSVVVNICQSEGDDSPLSFVLYVTTHVMLLSRGWAAHDVRKFKP